MLQPSITLLGFTLHEPVTVLTDFLLSFCCLILYSKSRKSHAKLWSLFFLCMAIATFLGALGHGLYNHKNNNLQWISRIAGIVSVLMASLASVQHLPKGLFKIAIRFTMILQFCIAMFLILQNNYFKIVAINGTIGFGFFVALLHFYFLKIKIKGAAWLLMGVLINAIAGLIHKFSLAPHKWFNHNDLSHVIMLFGLFYIAKGAIQIQQNFNT